MKKRIIFTLCIIIILICAVCSNYIANKRDEDYSCNNNAGMIESKNYEGVILTDDSKWIPSNEDIKQFEIGLVKYLDHLVKSDGVDEEGFSNDVESLKYIIKNIKNYKHQYMGVSKSGDKIY